MSAIMNIDFGMQLLKLLEDKGWTQADLARRTGRSRTAISDVISGKRPIGQKLALDIATALNIDADDFFRNAGLLPPKPGELSPKKRELLHLAEQADDETVDLA